MIVWIAMFTRRNRRLAGADKSSVGRFVVQVPSDADISSMEGLPAGYDERQKARLNRIKNEVLAALGGSQAKCIQTNEPELLKNWSILFGKIKEGDAEAAIRAFNQLSDQNDIVYDSIIEIHTKAYLISLIELCAKNAPTKSKKTRTSDPEHPEDALALSADIQLNNDTFEILLKDLATTLAHKSAVFLSFGLPSHHAYPDRGSGFCSLNKTAAIVCANDKKQQISHHLVLGIDVNRDDGLSDIFSSRLHRKSIVHIDIFDSQVYPVQSFKDFEKNFTATKPGKIDHGIKDNYHYFAIDLLKIQRDKENEIHPAIQFALEKLQEKIKEAKGGKIYIYLPTGWDSHQKECAPCGKKIHDGESIRDLVGVETKKRRFNDADFNHLTRELLEIYNKHPQQVEIYWGLEGGYTYPCFSPLIHQMFTTVKKVLNESAEEAPGESPSGIKPP